MSDTPEIINEIGPETINEKIEETPKTSIKDILTKPKEKQKQTPKQLQRLEKARVYRELNNKRKKGNDEKVNRLKKDFDIDIDIFLKQLEEKKQKKKQKEPVESSSDESEAEDIKPIQRRPPLSFSRW